MKRILYICIVLVSILGCKQADNTRIVKRIDHFMLESDKSKECYDFLTETCNLPIAWAYADTGYFRSGGVFLGNCILEPVEFNHIKRTGITGIAFTPSVKIEDVQKILKDRGVNETTINYQREWTTLGIDNLVSNGGVFFCEYRNPSLSPMSIRDNVYGIKKVNKVTINTSNFSTSHLVWEKLLTKHKEPIKGFWTIKGSPSIELVEGSSDDIESLQIKVNNIDKVKALLLQNGMLDIKRREVVRTDPEKSFGIIFEFIE